MKNDSQSSGSIASLGPLSSNTADNTVLPDSWADCIDFAMSHLDSYERISPGDKDIYVALFTNFSNQIFAGFPSPKAEPCQWHAHEGEIGEMVSALEVIQRSIVQVDGVFCGSGELPKKLFKSMLELYNVLDDWVESDVQESPGIPSPESLRRNLVQVIVEFLRSLGGSSAAAVMSEEPLWKTLRCILEECLGLVDDLVGWPTTTAFPAMIHIFERPRVQLSADGKLPEFSKELRRPVILKHGSALPSVASFLLEIMVATVHPAIVSQWFLQDCIRRINEAARKVFEFCLSPTLSLGNVTRAKALVRVLTCLSFYVSVPHPMDHRTALSDLPHQLLRRRLMEGPKEGWEHVDAFLPSSFESPMFKPPSRADFVEILGLLRAEQWGDGGADLRFLGTSYLHACLPHISQDILEIHRESLLALDLGIRRLAVTALLQSRLAPIPPEDVVMDIGESVQWRILLRGTLHNILLPAQIYWMDDDDDLSDQEYIQRAIDDMKIRFERPLSDTMVASRLTLIDNMDKFLRIVLTRRGSWGDGLSTISSALTVLARVSEGNADEVTVSVRRRVYKALATSISCHGTRDGGMERLDDVLAFVLRGMTDADRGVRLSAGHSFGSICETNERQVGTWKSAEELFIRLYGLMRSERPSVQETVIVTVGTIGKTKSSNILGQVLCFLIAQLPRSNIILNGLASLQVLSVTKHHNKKSPYPLFLPYMDKIAPFLVTRVGTQPSLMADACRLLCIAPSDFITITLPRTLPPLFASCDAKVIDILARDTGYKSSSLLMKHSHIILAHIFLLPGVGPGIGKTDKALDFVLGVLRDAATEGSGIDIQSVVKSCVVPLLAELVVVMGDEEAEAARLAIPALKKVEKLLAPTTGRGRAAPPPPDLGMFLKSYMLGLISHINDMLQDVQGKKSVASKRKILRSLGALVAHIGKSVSNVAPQIMATFQTMVGIPELSDVTLDSWYRFLKTLGPDEIGPYVGPTSAAFVSSWPNFSAIGQGLARQSLEYIILEIGGLLEGNLDDVVDLSNVPELSEARDRLKELRVAWTPQSHLQKILERCMTDNFVMAMQSLGELKTFMLVEHPQFVTELASGDMFDPLVGQILTALSTAACRDGEGYHELRLLAFECIGILGAVDPDRCEIGYNDSRMIVLTNFVDEEESMLFALHLIRDLLVGAFRSTSDIKYQSHLAYSIQELLHFCKFTPALVAAGHSSVPIRVRNRWNSLPKHVLETVTPLLEARFTLNQNSSPDPQHPIYHNQSTYREWIQLWATHLISRATGNVARTIFGVFRSAVRNKDVVVAHHLLPHLILNILVSGSGEDSQRIRSELLAVLEDQVAPESTSTPDKKLLSAQAVFTLLDHLNKWVRKIRQEIISRKAQPRRVRTQPSLQELENQLSHVDSVLLNIDQHLMAKAALQCRAYARSLMSFERQIVDIRDRSPHSTDLPGYYERLHEIYAHLDEPDGMEGVSTLLLSPSLEHQIRQHESTGRWTSAQSCWEVRLQQSPDNVDFHIGLLRCLRNLGHYDTLRTHVAGVLIRKPDWESALAGFEVESAWMVGAWDVIEDRLDRLDITKAQNSSIVMAQLLVAMKSRDNAAVDESLSKARSVLGAPITAAGVNGYRRAYEAALDLHVAHELATIYKVMISLPSSPSQKRETLNQLWQSLSGRLDSTLPTFRTREPVLSMRRTAIGLISTPGHASTAETGRSWLLSAKIARKAGQWQTAYSAVLQAQQSKAPFPFMESSRLVKANREPLRALQELENSMRLSGFLDDDAGVLDLTLEHDDEAKMMKAKAQVLRARWMDESERFEVQQIFKAFLSATELQPEWESSHFYLGQYQDHCYKALPQADKVTRGMKMNLYTVRSYAKALKYGSKFVYQTVPRLLTIWLDLGEDRATNTNEVFKRMNESAAKAIKETPVYKWFTAFPQIVSRVGHTNADVYKHLSRLIIRVLEEYPKQGLWLFTSVIKSTKANREQRGRQILDLLRNNPANARTQIPKLINECVAMSNELLALCDRHVDDNPARPLTMARDFPRLAALGRSSLIIPLQESLTVSLPPTSSSESLHQPFPSNAPTFQEFFDEIEVMRSLAKPRKITIRGSNGQIYMFLGKPKDDLRKDARLMDFNAIINKLLKANSESRRRQLHIRTYGVVTLNEECGFIQWVPNTIPIRPVLIKSYDIRGRKSWNNEMNEAFRRIKELPDKEAVEVYKAKILTIFQPIFHEWFIETFPEPSAWLASRLAYGRTAAVMSMVGFILGLGDRHCENILLDTNTGDVVHVDFNCLFEKGKTLETPERVPFRLTQNLVDGLGVTGVEGVFRIACEVTMQLLRDNKDSLMSVLDAFIHDPLVEWEDEKRKLEREPSRRNQNHNHVRSSVDLRSLAKNALKPIQKKLNGVYTWTKDRNQPEREVSTSNMVQMLIMESTDMANLAKMYPGWAPWH